MNRFRRASIGFILIVAFGVFGYLTTPHSDGALHLVALDVGQGDAILVRAPNGQVMLIDGGPAYRRGRPAATVLSRLGRNLPYGTRKIDYVVLTHPHADHVAGLLSVLKRYEISEVIVTGVIHTTDTYLHWLSELDAHHVHVRNVRAGDAIVMGDVHLMVLAPFDDLVGKRIRDDHVGSGGGLNDSSIVLLMSYQKDRALMMGDATSAIEGALLETSSSSLRADVLKVGHHGSKYSSMQTFVDAVAPRFALISVGANRYGHPSDIAIEHLKTAGAEVLRTDELGDIELKSNGSGFKRVIYKNLIF